jgi:hypothetical protein
MDDEKYFGAYRGALESKSAKAFNPKLGYLLYRWSWIATYQIKMFPALLFLISTINRIT